MYIYNENKVVPNMDNLFILMLTRGVSAKKLSKDTGIRVTSLSEWKNGCFPSAKNLVILADYFECSIDFLLGRANSECLRNQN